MKSEQITKDKSLIIDYDDKLTSKIQILNAFNKALNGKCYSAKYQKYKDVYCYKNNNVTHYFLAGSITYLSKPHPIFKKRYQLKKWFKEFYSEYKDKENVQIHLIGIYHYKGLLVFCEFNTTDYIERKLNSSAAHVYSNDIYQAVVHGMFQKIDNRNNKITCISSSNFKEYLDGEATSNPIFELFEKFNKEFKFNSWITAKEAILEMKNANWYQWKGTEWPGWFVEYKISEFINKEKCKKDMLYIGNIKEKTMLDFDLFFEEYNFYGDLKASDINKDNAPGNDQVNVLEAISKYGHLWYIIYEHETIIDKNVNNEMAIERMNLIGNPYKPGEEISYANRMKHSVKFKSMKIYEINPININHALSTFNQGHQPDGSARNPKFLINKKDIDNYVVYSYGNKN